MPCIWYHTNTTPQQIGTHNNTTWDGEFDVLVQCLEGARKIGACGRPNWPSVVCAIHPNGDLHLFQTAQHWHDYPSGRIFSGVYSDVINV